jgi:Methyltransferase small domain
VTPSPYSPALASLRKILRAADFTGRRIRAGTSLVEHVAHPELQAAVAALQIRESADSHLATLVAMFGCGEPVARHDLEALFPSLDLLGLVKLELVKFSADDVVPLVRLTEIDGLVFAYDLELERRPDMVVGISSSTRVSMAYTPRIHVARALDVGTGCGVHALLASRHASHVVATDINPRALRLTELNAALNGITNVETREGNLFEPVAGEQFGLIVANPPYVISPDTTFLYRDAGFDGDALCRQLLRELPAHLEDGGFATLQGNWAHESAAAWWSPLEGDLSVSGCDAYVLRSRTQDPLAYAVGWLSRPAPQDLDAYAATLKRWRESYEQAGIEAITTMVVLLRRRSGANWCYAITEEAPPRLELADGLERLFTAQDRLARAGLSRLRRAPGLRVENHFGPGEEAGAVLECAVALGTRRGVSQAAATVVVGADGDEDVAFESALEAELQTLVHLGYLTFAPDTARGRIGIDGCPA